MTTCSLALPKYLLESPSIFEASNVLNQEISADYQSNRSDFQVPQNSTASEESSPFFPFYPAPDILLLISSDFSISSGVAVRLRDPLNSERFASGICQICHRAARETCLLVILAVQDVAMKLVHF